jgi:hypothetical protein
MRLAAVPITMFWKCIAGNLRHSVIILLETKRLANLREVAFEDMLDGGM